MKNEKDDRRSIRTQTTLMNSLAVLLAERYYDDISVLDIITQANVGRSTFYAHFSTKDDLLKSCFERALHHLVGHIDLDTSTGNLRLDSVAFFDHVREHYNLYRSLVWGSGLDILSRDGLAALSEKFEERLAPILSANPNPVIQLDILAYSMAGNLLLILKWWLDQKMPYPSEKMDAIIQQIVVKNTQRLLELTEIT